MNAPTEWTYGGVVDWSDINNLRLMPYQYALRPIIESIKEKCKATNTNIPTLLNSEYNPLYDRKPYLDSIKDIILNLIPQFANHTDNSGDWEGETDIPAWTVSEIKQFGYRADASPKGQGYFGELIRYDDSESYSTEISVGVTIGGEEIEIPLLVPTLTDDEVVYLLSNEDTPDGILNKAIAYAEYRLSQEKSPFAEDGEQNPRDWMPTFTSNLVSPRLFLYQQYQMLNLMRWHRFKLSTVSIDEYRKSFDGASYLQTWSEAVSVFKATSWSFDSEWNKSFNYGAKRLHPTYEKYYIGASKNKKTIAISSELEYSADIYLYLNAVNQTIGTLSNPNQLNLYKTITELSGSNEFEFFNDDDIDAQALNEPTYSGVATQYLYGDINKSYIILKFDGANGFKFKNW